MNFTIGYIIATIATFIMMIIVGAFNVAKLKDIPAFSLLFFFSDFGFPFVCLSIIYWSWRIFR